MEILNEGEGWAAEPPKPFLALKRRTVDSFGIGAMGDFENFPDGSPPLYYMDSRKTMGLVFGIKKQRINFYVFITSEDGKSVDGYARAFSSNQFEQALKLGEELARASRQGTKKFQAIIDKNFRKDGNKTYATQKRNNLRQIIHENLDEGNVSEKNFDEAYSRGFLAGMKLAEQEKFLSSSLF